MLPKPNSQVKYILHHLVTKRRGISERDITNFYSGSRYEYISDPSDVPYENCTYCKINQPDPRVAGFVIYNWLAEDIWLYGAGYGQVLEMYSSTDGGRVRAWTRVSPDRVTVDTDFRNTVIESYKVDGMAVPLQGVGSLIRFDGPDEGLLHSAGKTIAAQLETALWTGDTTSVNVNLNRFDGLVKLIGAASGVVAANASTFISGAPLSSITAANVISIFDGVYQAIPAKVVAADDERHICPLQLDVIERAMQLWTAPDDVVFNH